MKTEDCYEQIAVRLGELHKRIKNLQNQMLKKYDISLMEYHILIMIIRMNDVSQNDIADALDVDKALISRQISAMEQKGLLSCAIDPECRRRKMLYLSEKAFALIPKLQEAHRLSLVRIFADIEEQQLFELQSALEGLVSKI